MDEYNVVVRISVNRERAQEVRFGIPAGSLDVNGYRDILLSCVRQCSTHTDDIDASIQVDGYTLYQHIRECRLVASTRYMPDRD